MQSKRKILQPSSNIPAFNVGARDGHGKIFGYSGTQLFESILMKLEAFWQNNTTKSITANIFRVIILPQNMLFVVCVGVYSACNYYDITRHFS